MTTDINTIWSDVLDIVRDELNGPSFKTWFEHTEALDLTDGGVFVVGVQNDFARAWLEDRYTQRLSAALTQVVGDDLTVQIVVDGALAGTAPSEGEAQPAEPDVAPVAQRISV